MERIAKLLAGSKEDQLIGIELLKTKRPRLTREIQGVLYAHASEFLYRDFLQTYQVKRARLLPDQTNAPDTTTWAYKYIEK